MELCILAGIAGVVGLAILLLYENLGLDLSGQTDTIIELVIAGLTAAGIWVVPNEGPRRSASKA